MVDDAGPKRFGLIGGCQGCAVPAVYTARNQHRGDRLVRVIRHPIMAGLAIAFWVTSRMTAGHLLFAAVSTGYILAALQLEERDRVRIFDGRYREYRRRVPMLAPLPFRRNSAVR